MALYYSPGYRITAANGDIHQGAFFDSALHGRDIPPDAVPIRNEAEYQRLLEARNDGCDIELASSGTLKIVRPVPDLDQRRAELVHLTRQEAARRIEAISPVWRQMNDMREPSEAGAARFAAIDLVRAASGLIEQDIAGSGARALKSFSVADSKHWPETI